MDTYLTRAEACERLRISRDTFRKLVKSGAIQAHRTSDAPYGHLRVSEQAIADYLERQAVAGQSA